MTKKYIDADHLKVEIERHIKEVKYAAERFTPNIGFFDAKLSGIYDVMAIIDSLHQEQPIQMNTLTWRDINDLERIINNVHYKFRCGIGEKSFGEEVLERFKDERDEQEQTEMNLEKFIEKIKTFQGRYKHPEIVSIKGAMAFMARMFYQYPDVARQWYEQLPKTTTD
jgi:hypothetical protein